jgi:antirestriction protein
MTTPEFRIYVAPCTNSTGGRWLDPLDADYDAAVAEISQDGQLEIFAPDHEGFTGIRTESVFELEDIAKAASNSQDANAFVAYMAYTGLNSSDALHQFDDAFCGEWDSEEAYAENLADETMEIPKHLWPYFNAEAFARDLFMSDYFSIDAPSGIHVFRNI